MSAVSNVLTQTTPARIARASRWAFLTSRVQIPAASPYGVSFAMRSASASSSNSVTVRTGPKISSRATRQSFETPSRIVGGT